MFRLLLILILLLAAYQYGSQHRGEGLDDGFPQSQGPGPLANPYGGGGSVGGGGSLTDRVARFVDQVKQDVSNLRENVSGGIARGIERLRNLGG